MRLSLSSLAVLATSFVYLTGTLAFDGPSCPGAVHDDTYFSVVGVQGCGIHPRLELRELEKDPTMWNLFIQAMAKFQAMDQADKLSYFQVAGIHGAPFGPWDGVDGDGLTGYCPHASNVFGTWHRPYLALFEQILHDRAVEIANAFPRGNIRKEYQTAAEKLRLPYWDWAMNPIDEEEGFQFLNWNTTIRYPSDGYSPTAVSRNDELSERIGAQQVNNRDTLYKLLTVYQPFNQWSNKANGGKIGSIETLHDGIHNTFGLGHVGIVEVSAFDPAFWLHHCNIDRLIAIYQKRYPDTYVEDSPQAKASYYYAKNSTQGPSSPLKPFHMNAKGDFWTSNVVTNWESFGYTYPELVGNPDNATLTKSINRLYKPDTQGLKTNQTLETRDSNGNNTANATDWMVEVNMPSDIQITYAVRAFLGEPNPDPRQWPTDKNYVGLVASLASPRTDSDVIITANIVLTDALAEKHANGELKSLEKHHVEAWLKDNFHWRIQQVDLTEIPRDNPPPGLNVTVVSVPIQLPEADDDVPVWPGGTAAFEYKPKVQAPPPVYPPNSTVGGGRKGGSWNGTSWNPGLVNGSHVPVPESRKPNVVTLIQTQVVTVDPPAATV
ncbi:Di-copper centre-containing protein [Aaosphaeria arxii CBS 175.79]|uniref:tyrosinase n=1 Tax=Aaosphaeria arxii CBS 175.79 TaxID=1450172 RepID=A0A6A5Y6Y8_9PLEO|nr:Di-copper centre-containing protein [Aaosphaeria arxii CBS 175.79]KAF2020511.1 Di-copper centre-containing protein [Aaosphaeria arxii CBS 175.79]